MTAVVNTIPSTTRGHYYHAVIKQMRSLIQYLPKHAVIITFLMDLMPFYKGIFMIFQIFVVFITPRSLIKCGR